MTHTVFIFICLMAVIIVSTFAIVRALYAIKKMREVIKEVAAQNDKLAKIVNAQNDLLDNMGNFVEVYSKAALQVDSESGSSDNDLEMNAVRNAASRIQISVENLNEAAKQFRKVGEAALK